MFSFLKKIVKPTKNKTKSYFKECLNFVLKHEGYFVAKKDVFQLNDGKKWTHKSGLTNESYGAWKFSRPATYKEMMQITMDEIETIYEERYWIKSKCHLLPGPISASVFDMAVNAGPKRSIILLQRALGVEDDGIVGRITLEAVHKTNIRDLIINFEEERIKFYSSLDSWPRFGRGWKQRAYDCREFSLSLI
jgi:lysozyme family protein